MPSTENKRPLLLLSAALLIICSLSCASYVRPQTRPLPASAAAADPIYGAGMDAEALISHPDALRGWTIKVSGEILSVIRTSSEVRLTIGTSLARIRLVFTDMPPALERTLAALKTGDNVTATGFSRGLQEDLSVLLTDCALL